MTSREDAFVYKRAAMAGQFVEVITTHTNHTASTHHYYLHSTPPALIF
jgi:hypothetical protein